MFTKITPCLWFDAQAEEAARHYISIFPGSKITEIAYYGEAGQEVHGGKPGSVLTVAFELGGTPFVALNGGPLFKFTEAISFQIECADQTEVDYYWDKLTPGGDPECQQCGWLKDKFGVSWQVVPAVLTKMITDPDKAASQRAFQAMMEMKKFNIAELERAFAGQ